MTLRPAISVLLPFYNAARTLPSALRSLRRQTEADFEVVCVDDGSEDDSAKIVATLAAADPRFRLVSRPHGGLVAALNAGLERCQGELLARMDADDICLRHRLQLQRELLERRPDLGAAGTLVRIAPRALVTDGMARYEAWLNDLTEPDPIAREIWVESPMCHPSAMIRTARLEAAGGYRDRGWPEDYDLWLRLHRQGVAMAKVPRVLLIWREGEHRLTRRSPCYQREQFLRLKLHHLSRFMGQRRALVWGAGMEGKPWLRALDGVGLLAEPRKVVDVDPRKVGQVIHGCRVITPEDLPPPDPSVLVIAAVGAPGARSQIRAYLNQHGYVEQQDFVCVA